jgi:N-acetylglucosaminyldiphosphoundecaprenol N-acetyl-beta-D-mannosaminyltransferase
MQRLAGQRNRYTGTNYLYNRNRHRSAAEYRSTEKYSVIPMKNRLKILDIWVDPVTMNETLTRIIDFIETGNRVHTIFAANPEKNFSVPRDPLLYEAFKNADILIPDGIGMVLAARFLHGITLSRVPGVELMHAISRLSAQKGYRIFIYGAREDVSRIACERLQVLYPGIHIVGRENGYLPQEKMPGLIDQINESGAEILFLALGSPKQERWLSEYRGHLKTVRVCQGIGGTLDTIAGTVKRAPDIWCRFNAEWLYRLISEPKRLKRQRVLPIFAVKVLGARIFKCDGCSKDGE